MALVVTLAPRAYSIGPVKQVVGTFTAVSGDTTGTVAVTTLSTIDYVEVTGGMRLTAAPVITGNSIALAFVDPSTGGYFGSIMIHGK